MSPPYCRHSGAHEDAANSSLALEPDTRDHSLERFTLSKIITIISGLLVAFGALIGLGLLSIGLDYLKEEAGSSAPIIESPAPSDGGGEALNLPF